MAKKKEEEPDITITRIWRHGDDPIAEIEYDETLHGVTTARKISDHSWPPTQDFMNAFDALATHIAAPYLVHKDFHRKVRPREVLLEYPEGGEQKVKLYGQIEPDGFDACVALRTPKQAASGKLLTAIARLVKQSKLYIDGERGTAPLWGDGGMPEANGDAADAAAEAAAIAKAEAEAQKDGK